jgi:uncharacterized membrane protein YebE (DUF533 family)
MNCNILSNKISFIKFFVYSSKNAQYGSGISNKSVLTANPVWAAVAAGIYLISRALVNLDNDQERNYMDQLAKELGLAPDLVVQLES